jgi:hypothetical protein
LAGAIKINGQLAEIKFLLTSAQFLCTKENCNTLEHHGASLDRDAPSPFKSAQVDIFGQPSVENLLHDTAPVQLWSGHLLLPMSQTLMTSTGLLTPSQRIREMFPINLMI